MSLESFIDIKSFWSHYVPGVDSASNRNEYQENFLGVKAAGAWGWQPYPHPVLSSWNLRTLISWNPLGLSRPVMGLLYLLLFKTIMLPIVLNGCALSLLGKMHCGAELCRVRYEVTKIWIIDNQMFRRIFTNTQGVSSWLGLASHLALKCEMWYECDSVIITFLGLVLYGLFNDTLHN